jgi:hypothetical protein
MSSTSDPTTGAASTPSTTPPLNDAAHAKLPERTSENGEALGSEQRPRHESHDSGKELQETASSGLHDILKDKKGKVVNKKEKLKQKSKPPGGFDDTPFPDAPQGYTVKFTFHRASNLPIADLHSKSADPFLHATLIAAVPKRHKEDPQLTRRTRTLRRTTEPAWEEDWVVANVPASGFTLKCRIYDEDWPDHDDRLGNVIITVPYVDENWGGLGPDGSVFEVKKRSGSKRAYFFRSVTSLLCRDGPMTPRLHISIDVLGKSDPPHAQMYTVEPTTWVKHYSPMIGRLMRIKVNKDEENDATSRESNHQTKKYEYVNCTLYVLVKILTVI